MMRSYGRRMKGKNYWSCDKCGALFTHQATLKVHSRSHTGEKPYVCEVCDSKFMVLGSLQQHIKAQSHFHPQQNSMKKLILPKSSNRDINSGEMYYKCELCFQIFSMGNTALGHLKEYHRVLRDDIRRKSVSSVVMGDTTRPDEESFNVDHSGDEDDAEALDNQSSDMPEITFYSPKMELFSLPDSKDLVPLPLHHVDENLHKILGPIGLRNKSLAESIAACEEAETNMVSNDTSISSADYSGARNGSSRARETEAEITDKEWEKLNRALSKRQNPSVGSSEGQEEHNAAENQDGHGGRSDEHETEEVEDHDVQILQDATSNTMYLTMKNTDMLTEEEQKAFSAQAQADTSLEGENSFNTDSTHRDDGQLFFQSLALRDKKMEPETPETSSSARRKSQRKSTLTKLFDWMNSNKLKCHICSATCGDAASLAEHMTRHEGTKTSYLKCSQCPKVFSTKYTLAMHERIHLDYRPFHCKVCGKGFYQQANVKVHMRSHTGERPYKCTICGKAYRVKLSLAAHSAIHTDINKFACPNCKFCFATEEELEKHMKVHAIQKSHECPRCKKKFLKAYLLEFHLQRDCKEKRYVCDHCGKQFSCQNDLKVHLRVHTGEKPFGCEICGKFFSQSANLSKHLKIHNNIRSFCCNMCNSTFIEKASLIAHKRTHTGEKPHMCDVCGVAFSSPSSLVIHLRVHTGEKPYPCDMCEKRFSSSGRLRDHVRTHTGEKPYRCKYCDKSFALSNGLARHRRIHTGERPHKCDVCGERFMRKYRLRKHQAMHLDNQIPRHERHDVGRRDSAVVSAADRWFGVSPLGALTQGQWFDSRPGSSVSFP